MRRVALSDAMNRTAAAVLRAAGTQHNTSILAGKSGRKDIAKMKNWARRKDTIQRPMMEPSAMRSRDVRMHKYMAAGRTGEINAPVQAANAIKRLWFMMIVM